MKSVLTILALALTLGLSSPAQAGSNVQSGGNFGLGVALGYPGNGVSMNYFLSEQTSIQADISLWGVGGNWLGVGMRADFLWYPGKLADLGFADLIWYWGPGVNLYSFSWSGPGSDGGYMAIGAELPVAIGFQFKGAPIDVNLEAVPILHILGNGGTDIGFGVAGVLNARYYF